MIFDIYDILSVNIFSVYLSLFIKKSSFCT